MAYKCYKTVISVSKWPFREGGGHDCNVWRGHLVYVLFEQAVCIGFEENSFDAVTCSDAERVADPAKGKAVGLCSGAVQYGNFDGSYC